MISWSSPRTSLSWTELSEIGFQKHDYYPNIFATEFPTLCRWGTFSFDYFESPQDSTVRFSPKQKRIMRKIIACEFMTLDGVIQNEDEGDGFKYGGWFFPYADEVTGAAVQERLAKPIDLLLGRKTFAAWETYWPTHSNFWPNVMTATKYVASNTRNSSDWQPTVFLNGDLAEKVRQLKQTEGPDLHVMGSADMLQTLFKADLVDALELMIIPITLGTGKRLFQSGTIPASFKVTSGKVAPKGIFIVTYERDGDVKTGAPQISED